MVISFAQDKSGQDGSRSPFPCPSPPLWRSMEKCRDIADSTAATKRWSDRSCIGASWRGISDHAAQGPTRPWRGFKNHPPTHGQRHRLRVFWQAKQGSAGAGTGGVSRRVEIARDDISWGRRLGGREDGGKAC